MTQHPHLVLRNTGETKTYTSTSGGGSAPFKTPPRDDRHSHGTGIVSSIRTAVADSSPDIEDDDESERPEGITLEFESDPGFALKIESLERERSGIELVNVREDGGKMFAVVFMPTSKAAMFLRIFERYIDEEADSGAPKNQALVESISFVRRATLRSFWTDSKPFPSQADSIWWEIWLRNDGEVTSVVEKFQSEAQRIGITVSQRLVRFPERIVLLAEASAEQWEQFHNLFDLLAELRAAAKVPTEFVELTPKEQAERIQSALERMTLPTEDAPAVCLLDTGVNRGHPLLAIALDEEHLLTVDPMWTPADRKGHGTEMAGLALYGCLTEVLESDEPLRLSHRLESVKILPDEGSNQPEHYGAITSEAVARAEVQSPTRNRAICLAVTAEKCDEGLPTSWSASVDQLCSGALDSNQRLMFVSAGNTPPETRHEYPERNYLEGVEDPSHSWNVVTVGAYTERCNIRSEEYAGWEPIAKAGLLSPCSRTSVIWEKKEWPLKPDIVMEGGNSARESGGGHADFIDDLALLTTRVSPTGALLTTSGETSGATAQAARFAAMVHAKYPHLWPETVRALIVHSAEWTDAMLEEFPYRERHKRIRCYGYGVPSLERALWSVSNAATMIVQDSLQPFDRVDGTMKTKDMRMHALPWPKEVLESLGEAPIKMRVTLSYFIEPSPGRRGWQKKHRYQSHGLRFDVKRPVETVEQFEQRLSKDAWENREERPDSVTEDRSWELGKNLRTRGSIHSDTWTGMASELAACGVIGVHPVTGWWRERPHLERWSRSARYALLVSLETDDTEIDLYTPIESQVVTEVETEVEIEDDF
ncbi:S8 family peptidase [Aeoliella sp.]|uniref:S8 family peptidase n=1 Tax=Aeoliella sp. TaxID=2795800 RepID=UPI003CCC3132